MLDGSSLDNIERDMEGLEAVDYSLLLQKLADKFFPIFVTVFLFILTGYLAGKFNILPSGRGKSVLASYIFNIALPAAILYNIMVVEMKSLDQAALRNFLTGILVVKSFLYLLVVGVGLVLVRRSGASWAVVFLFALATVHSNDYAIGQPLLNSLFDANCTVCPTFNITADYPSYMDTSMVIVYATYVPLTIFFLELSRNRELSLTWGKSLLYAVLGTLLRPVVLAALVGLVFRAAVGVWQPNIGIRNGFMKWIGNGFIAQLSYTIKPLFLLYTGLVLVGSICKHFTSPRHILTTTVVAILKLGVSPLLLRLTLMFLDPSHTSSNSDAQSILFYLYGTLPTSPVLVIFASQYELLTPVFAIIVLVTTLGFAPVSTLFMALYYVKNCQLFSSKTAGLVKTVTEGFGYSSLALGIWMLLVLIFLGKYRKFTYQLLIGQISCLIVYSSLIGAVQIYELSHLQAMLVALSKGVAVCLFSILGSSYLFIIGLIHRGRMVTNILTRRIAVWYVLFCLLLPTALLALTSLPITPNKYPSRTNRNYIWDYCSNNISTAFVATKLIILTASITLSVLPKFLRYCNTSEMAVRDRLQYERLEDGDETSDLSTGMRDFHLTKMGRRFSYNGERNPWDMSEREAQRFQVAGFLSMVLAMLTILVEIWGIIATESSDGSKAFVGGVLLYQNFLFFVAIIMTMLFGTPFTEMKDQFVNLKETLAAMISQDEELSLPTLESLSQETIQTCHRFIQYHMGACVSAVGQSVEGTIGASYTDVFTGEDLVTWLINVGLAEDRDDGVEYGSRLIKGRVMEHIDKRRSFYDRHYLYRFARDISSVARSFEGSSDFQNEFHVSRNAPSLPDWF